MPNYRHRNMVHLYRIAYSLEALGKYKRLKFKYYKYTFQHSNVRFILGTFEIIWFWIEFKFKRKMYAVSMINEIWTRTLFQHIISMNFKQCSLKSLNYKGSSQRDFLILKFYNIRVWRHIQIFNGFI